MVWDEQTWKDNILQTIKEVTGATVEVVEQRKNVDDYWLSATWKIPGDLMDRTASFVVIIKQNTITDLPRSLNPAHLAVFRENFILMYQPFEEQLKTQRGEWTADLSDFRG